MERNGKDSELWLHTYMYTTDTHHTYTYTHTHTHTHTHIHTHTHTYIYNTCTLFVQSSHRLEKSSHADRLRVLWNMKWTAGSRC